MACVTQQVVNPGTEPVLTRAGIIGGRIVIGQLDWARRYKSGERRCDGKGVMQQKGQLLCATCNGLGSRGPRAQMIRRSKVVSK
ncbi:hypothetical protein COCSUDRAFT_59703 [Coccomyxa subellipsoidea C-169]|uniref:Uncharacterized protein n=1 Tax=Coccomyxa subellipsoidea (strain C-169) TaxID=574566 RepID=I0YLF0_COCSC|nr:hypothetical protein COCSUDRAFT_59703 [Coccomyxa subellipsoidea C-169]EIE19219.1 hypothetical protein COCSUDRAFT_59703 [Coccomyxa subellipsoidea C-169]|eukprot:XP_005643763.1 hypothetical protein COCSUDRAFT_59703 [Coccomyxa subellipsoidea C-169]